MNAIGFAFVYSQAVQKGTQHIDHGMVMNLFIVEKPACARALKDAGIIKPRDMIISLQSLGLWKPSRKRISLSDIPYSEDVELCKRAAEHERYPLFRWRGEELVTSYVKLHYTTLVSACYGRVGNAQSKIKGVYVLCSMDRLGAFAVNSYLSMFRNVVLPEVEWFKTQSFSKAALSKDWEAADFISNDEFIDWYEQYAIKREFDALWNINSSAVFGELQTKLNIPADKVLSKYQLMTLNVINEQKQSIDVCRLIDLMQRWKGSGKYSSDNNVMIGSVVSQHMIIDSLIKRGFIISRQEGLSLSNSAKVLLSYTHKRTYDPDLPYRLEKWMTDKDRQAMKRYIRTVFGRQLRFQRNKDKLGTEEMILTSPQGVVDGQT